MSLRYLVISDVHLGHKRTSTEFIIKNLFDYLSTDMLKKIDVLFIAGDFFDRLMNLHSPETYEVMFFIRVLFERLHRARTSLRVLKGTQSHDFDQCNLFDTVYKCVSTSYNVDFLYIDKLHIENFLNKYDILYLPDEWKPSSEMVMRDVRTLLKGEKLDKVDIIIMHGMFKFQLPEHIHSPLIHNEFDFLNICRYYIHPGHIHQSSTFDRIIAQGSFDRLTHNEEQPKGGYLCEVGEDGCKYEFIENKGAKKYITLSVKKKPLDDVAARLSKLTSKLPPGSYVRLKANVEDDAVTYVRKLQERFIDFNITLKVINEKEKDKDEDLTSIYKPVSINRDNVKELLFEMIARKDELDTDTQRKMNIFIDEILKDV